MAEPEDLILEGAHLATRVVRGAWTRYGPARTPGEVALGSVRSRLELFLTALFRQPIAVAAAEPPAPPTWLSRIAHRSDPRTTHRTVLPATDGIRIYLPPSLRVTIDEEHTVDVFRLIAVEQGARLVRGTSRRVAGLESRAARERLLVQEGTEVDRWIATELPGLVPTLLAARAQALADRPRVPREHGLEQHLRHVLAAPPHDSESIGGVPDGPCPPVAPVWHWGRLVEAPAPVRVALREASDPQDSSMQKPRVAEMRRRPRVRDAREDEDDRTTGPWVIRADEPQESVEDPFGLTRPADQDDTADPEGLADSLSDLPEARVVRTPDRAREVLRGGEDPPNHDRRPEMRPEARGTAYPEWDYREGRYRVPGAIVREPAAALGDAAWVRTTLMSYARLTRRVRARFERLRPRRIWIGRQPDGSELDIDAFVTSAADLRAGSSVDGRLYVARRQARRELSAALLVDVSASTDSWVSADRRIVDVEKEALLVVCEALDALGDPYAIYAFSGEGPKEVSVRPLKALHERSSLTVRRRIAGLDSDRYTRIGAAIRHVTLPLGRQPSERRLLLVLSDGKPNDVDLYEGRYGIEDTRQAVAEARRQGIAVFCLTVDREAPRYAARIFGRAGFAVLNRPAQLPAVLIEALRHLIT